MEYWNSVYEYVVSPRKKKKYKWMRVGLLGGYFLFVGAVLILGIHSKLGVPLLSLLPLLTWMLVYFTWRYVTVEFAYAFEGRKMTVTYIYNGKKRKVKAAFSVADVKAVAPMRGRMSTILDYHAPDFVLDITSLDGGPDAYYLIAEVQGGQRIALLFDATDKALSILGKPNG